MNDYEKMISGRLYNSASKELFWPHARGLMLQEKYNRTPLWREGKRKRIMKKLIPNIGKDFWIWTNFHCEYGKHITIGDRFFANFDCMILDVSPVTIGDDVMFGPRVTVATPVHPFLAEERNVQEYPDGLHDLEYSKPIKIGNGVWVAAGVTICGGVTIGDNVVIAAGAVVTRDIPSNCLVAGVPARVLRELDEKDKMDVWNTYLKEDIPISIRDKEKNR